MIYEQIPEKYLVVDEEDEEQYKQQCGNYCGCTLTMDTPIMIWNKGEEELTLCSDCYWEAGFWKDDENEENEDGIRDSLRVADIPTYSRTARSILLATASASRLVMPSLRPHRLRSTAAASGFGTMEKVLPKG